jgi:CheY-like chemotaxis protein
MRRDILALIVDDSEINLIVTQEILRSLSVEAELAGSGAMAVELCRTRRYDMILMDHLMPEMDGIEAAQRIRAITDTPVVAMTANDDPDAQALFLANGFAGFLQKPVEPEQLSDLLERLLSKKKPRADTAINAGADGGSRKEERPAVTLPDVAARAGLDMRDAVAKLGGNEATYVSVLKLFTQTGPEKLRQLEDFLGAWDWKHFLILIHGQKTALANIGATALNEEARIIESALRDGKYELVEAVFGGFSSRYSALCGSLRILWAETAAAEHDATEEDCARLPEILRQINHHIEHLEQDKALEALAALLNIRFKEPLGSGLAALRNAVNAYDYDAATELIGRLTRGAT